MVESHTHFRPAKYDGPKTDRIRILEDTNDDGRADKFTTFFEGTTATMDLAVHPDGSVYVATRNEILRLRDTNDDGKADESTRLIAPRYEGQLPAQRPDAGCRSTRAAISTSAWGRTSARPYKLIGSDGTTLTGGGEGGNVYHCTCRRQEAAPRRDRLLEPLRLVPRHLRPPLRGGQRPGRVAALPTAPRRRGRRLRLPVPLWPRRTASVPVVERRACPARCRWSRAPANRPAR